MFHCHVLWHQSSGMAMAFQVSSSEVSNPIQILLSVPMGLTLT
jgi:hypothetical protein